MESQADDRIEQLESRIEQFEKRVRQQDITLRVCIAVAFVMLAVFSLTRTMDTTRDDRAAPRDFRIKDANGDTCISMFESGGDPVIWLTNTTTGARLALSPGLVYMADGDQSVALSPDVVRIKDGARSVGATASTIILTADEEQIVVLDASPEGNGQILLKDVNSDKRLFLNAKTRGDTAEE